jgi:hypothetical protein
MVVVGSTVVSTLHAGYQALHPALYGGYYPTFYLVLPKWAGLTDIYPRLFPHVAAR